MQDLVIHVGLGKTGSSAIQKSFRVNSPRLRKEGVHYCDLWLTRPSVGKHGFSPPNELMTLLRADKDAAADRLMAIFNPDNPAFADAHTVVWSNEALAMQWVSMGNFIARVSDQCNVKIILYFRNQVDWLVSAYLQWAIKDKQTAGRIRTWQQFLKDTKRVTDYISVIENWKTYSKTAQIIHRSYDSTDNIVHDFISVIGLKIELEGERDRIYETPGYTALALFKILNDQYDEPKQPEPLLRLLEDGNVLERDLHSVDPCPLDIPENELDALAATYTGVNHRLREEYGIQLNTSHKPLRVGRRRDSEKTNTDLVAALLMMILRLDQRVKDLQSAVRSLAKPEGGPR